MKSLGKKEVTMRVYNNGVFRYEYLQDRTVYAKKDGGLFINDNGGKHPVTEGDGMILAEFNVQSVGVRRLTLG